MHAHPKAATGRGQDGIGGAPRQVLLHRAEVGALDITHPIEILGYEGEPPVDLNLLPVMAVVTNIDNDHMETYGHDFARLKGAFIEFLSRLPFYGHAVLCIDDKNVREILPLISKPVLTYGFAEQAQFRAAFPMPP